ncbi:rod shape-determining protein RodA [Rubrobacter radiotolerans]|uniref:Peptidoglycan glycosyltransferase RodA n=1 Tax=Rubrobacter radiotolerans TaxID=42256 RepID=A0A023X3A0_RUBRA|nr:rod shape-determining protein RodA [Rubrobacter radiotolerans]AHY46818.1 rod shape-determining protein RodA [Rubrobacter radiotolerans]MDX5894225.1 rod shape-determining protein RodA [Rubrobacter radiotolerans]SMC05506.1 rod shape determining protein RodA [Rubrobacter radiotolerans DSM 5868]
MSTITRTSAGPIAGNLGRWRHFDPVLLVATLGLCAFGILGAYVAGSDDSQTYVADQMLGLIVGVAVGVPLALVDYRVWRKHLRTLYVVAIVILLLVIFFGTVGGGSQSWIDFGPVTIQPSEFAKVLMVLVLAGYFAERTVADTSTFIKALGLLAVPGALVFIQPDLGTALVFGASFIAMAYIGGARFSQLAAIAGSAALAAYVVIRFGFLHEYQVARLTAFWNPAEAGDAGYQVEQSKTAIGSGGLTGKGIEARTLATGGYLPEDHTDFIFANLAERIGFFGSALLILLFFVLIWRILHIATISRDRFGILIAVGLGAIFLFQVLVNIGMTMGIMPVTGLPLPFVSYGRSSLVVSLIALGLLQSIAMRSRQEISTQPRI